MAYLITTSLPKDLPENWDTSQYVSPNGTEVGLTIQHGYNYLSKQVNAAQAAALELDKLLVCGWDNLVDNGLFIDPVSRIPGYVAPVGTTYYSDVSLTTSVGVTTEVFTVTNLTISYGTIEVSGVARYVSPAAVAFGYVHLSTLEFGVDRWCARLCAFHKTTGGMLLQATNSTTAAWLRQLIAHCDLIAGRTVTLSILVKSKSGTASATFGLYKMATAKSTSPTAIATKELVAGLNTLTVTLPADIGDTINPFLGVQIVSPYNVSLVIAAIKLNLGSVSTLAYLDTDSTWKLIDIPNRVLEQVRCNGANGTIGGIGMIVHPEDIGLSTANVLASAEVVV